MRKKIKLLKLSLSLIFLLSVLAVQANTPLYTAKKTITKSFPVTDNSQLFINNQYGDVRVKTWGKSSVSVAITIVGQSKEMTDAASLIKLINIDARINATEIKLTTVIDTGAVYRQLPDDKQCHISYEISAPDWLVLYIKNSFGNIQTGNHKGNLEIDQKFGDFKAGNLTGLTRLSVEQGNVVIDGLSNSELTIKGFKTIQIADLSGNINADFSYGSQVDLGLSNQLRQLSVKADNVKPLSIRNLREANADLKIHALLSKCIYNGIIQFVLDNKASITQGLNYSDGDTLKKDSLLLLKKFKELPFMKKVNDYAFKTGNAKTDIKINVSFSVLDVKD